MIDRALEVIIVVIFAIVVASVTWQVISRYLLPMPSTVTAELARLLFMWLALIGGAYTFGQGRHLALDLLPMSLTGRPKQVLGIVILSLIGGFAVLVMIWGGGGLVSRTLATGQITPTLGVPMGYIYAPIPFSGAVILFYCIDLAVRQIRNPELTVTSAPEFYGEPDLAAEKTARTRQERRQ